MSDYRDPNDPTWRNAAYDPNARGYSSTWGWVIGALFVLVVLVIAFGTKHEGSQTASNDVTPPAATRMAPAPAPSLTPPTAHPAQPPSPANPAPAPKESPIVLGNSTSSPSMQRPRSRGAVFLFRRRAAILRRPRPGQQRVGVVAADFTKIGLVEHLAQAVDVIGAAAERKIRPEHDL